MKLRHIAVFAVAALVAMPLMAQQASQKADASAKPTDKAAQKDDAKTKKDDHDHAVKKDTANARAAAREAKKGKELEEETHPL